jgi:hypothetical protein
MEHLFTIFMFLSSPLVTEETGLEVNFEETKYMFMSRDQHAGLMYSFKACNKFCSSLKQLKYLGKTLTNQNCIHEEIKRRLHSGNVCHLSVQDLLSSILLSKTINIKYTELSFCMLFCMGVKLGLSHGGRQLG